MIPVDVQNVITSYLTSHDSETEEEFIERTKKLKSKQIPDDCEQDMPQYQWGQSSRGTLTACSPHGTNVALLQLLCGNDELRLKLIHHGKEQRVRNETIIDKEFSHLALSQHATMFATIDKIGEIDHSNRQSEVMRYIITAKTLQIHSIATNETQEYAIPMHFNYPYCREHPSIAFNKQGTHIIMHGIDRSQKQPSHNFGSEDSEDIGVLENPVPHHIIIPLTISTRPVPVTLQHYFEQNGVCKQISQ